MGHNELHKDLSIRQASKSTLIQVMIHPILATLKGEWQGPAPCSVSSSVCSAEDDGSPQHQEI